MKEMNCDVIRDLIPLCAEGLCSEESKQLVETHVAGCESCRRLYDQPPEDTAPVHVPDAGTAMQKVSRRMKRSKVKIALLSVAAVGLAGLLGVLSVGQVIKRNPVPSFETLWQSADVRPLVHMLTSGDYAGFVDHAGEGLTYTAALGSYLQLDREKDVQMLRTVYESVFGDTRVDHIRVRSEYSETLKDSSRFVVSYVEIFYEDGRELDLQMERDIDGLYRCEAVSSGGLTDKEHEHIDLALGFIADHVLRSKWAMESVMLSDVPFTDSKEDQERLARRCEMMVGHRFAGEDEAHIAAQLMDFYNKGYTVEACDFSDVRYDKEAHALYYRLHITASDGEGTAALTATLPFDWEGLHAQAEAEVFGDGCSDALVDDLSVLFQ